MLFSLWQASRILYWFPQHSLRSRLRTVFVRPRACRAIGTRTAGPEKQSRSRGENIVLQRNRS